MYIEVKIVEDGKVKDTFYDDISSVDGLEVGKIIPEERLHSDGSKSYRKYKIVSREETTNRPTTQTDPEKIRPMLKLSIEEIPINL